MTEYETITISTEACIKIAMMMWNEYVKAMEPPLYVFLSFPDWLIQQQKRHPRGGYPIRL